MSTKAHCLEVYEQLAGWYDRQGQAKLRDWFLVLAADAALTLGRADQAERLRQRLLHVNPHHLLRPFSSFAEGLQSPDVQSYVADLRRNYPPETAEQLLQATLKKSGSGLKATGLSQHHEAAEAERELKVYRAREVPDDPIPLAQPVPTAELHHPAPPAHPQPAPPASPRMPKPIAWTRPPAAIPLRAVPPASKVDEALDDDDEGPTGFGYWTSSVLFLVTLLLGLGLLVYSLARPFWQ